MAEDEPFPFSGARGVRGLLGTINHLVARGNTLDQTLEAVQGIYEQYGGRFTSQSVGAVTRAYEQFKEAQVKGLQVGNYINNVYFTSRQISFDTLTRSMDEFNNRPQYNVRYHVIGSVDGAPVDEWRTAIYSGKGALPPSVFDLANEIAQTQLKPYEQFFLPSDVEIAEVQISAV